MKAGRRARQNRPACRRRVILFFQVRGERETDVGRVQGQPVAAAGKRRVLDRIRVQARRRGAFADGRQRPLLVPVSPVGRRVADGVRGVLGLVGRGIHPLLYVPRMLPSWTERAGAQGKGTVITISHRWTDETCE